MALRHWFRSAEITTLLNRLGHSETYSFYLELETSIAYFAVGGHDKLLPSFSNISLIFLSEKRSGITNAGNCPSIFSCAWHFVTGFEMLRSQHF
jgi:hypothetical protein